MQWWWLVSIQTDMEQIHRQLTEDIHVVQCLQCQLTCVSNKAWQYN